MVGVVLVHHHQGVGTHDFFQGRAHRVREVQPCGGLHFFNEVGQHLGVGVADEVVASVREQFTKRFVVLDDAVVDDGDLSVSSEVRVGIHVVGGAVRGPSRVSDADRALGLMLAHVAGEVGHLPCRFSTLRAPSGSRVAMPALSYPRYSKRLSPSIKMG